MIRRTQPGVALISPPPHHDIYSIEDLAQLIYNLRQAHPGALVSVKIPAVTDIGTIAVGIAKAGADIVDVSGFEGGTGAASSSSIEHAGLPLERALSETHQALALNGIRGRVRIRADGGIKTGFDVAAVLALGADEVSLGTALMVAEQCIFCHGCANGLCPAGITTQSDLVARRLMTEKKGRPADALLPNDEDERYEDAKNGVMRYLRALAADLRRRLAAAGLAHPRELVGRVDLLERRPSGDPRKDKVDLSELLVMPDGSRPGAPPRRLPVDPRLTLGAPGRLTAPLTASAPPRLAASAPNPTSALNARICADAAAGQRRLAYEVSNGDRAVGATLCGKIALGEIAVPERGLSIDLRGYAGQALGFALVDGVRIALTGFANDTPGEAMGGGELVLRPPEEVPPEQRGALSVCGNAACYGRAGQRVGVRNSGAAIVVEGAGKYAFEYMTGGVGVVLGPAGPAIGSGMTGGVLYLLRDAHLEEKVHSDARIEPLDCAAEEALKRLMERHQRATGSHRARALLERWDAARRDFVKVVPAI
jgi:glutamate synthase domain-containing protein 3